MSNRRILFTLPFLFAGTLAFGACANDDGPTPAQLARLHAEAPAIHADHGAKLFDQLDADHDGRLSQAELDGATGMGAMIVYHQAEIDADSDGYITRAELAAAIDRHQHAHGDAPPAP